MVERGQVWRLGRHTLLCGDATRKEDVEKLMNGEKATLGFFDPPYGMKKENDGVLNDNLNYDDLLEFNKKWIPLSLDALTNIGSWYCWGQDEPLMDIYAFVLRPLKKTVPLTFRNLITWNKGTGQGQKSDLFRSYPVSTEKCIFIMKGRQVMSTNADNYWEGWEPIRAYLDGERQKMGWDIPTVKRIVGHSDLAGDHWFCKSQWSLPTRKVYEALQSAANGKAFKRDYDELKRDYDENCRAYFNNTHDNMNDVWNYPTNPFGEIKTKFLKEKVHPTTKPQFICKRAIKSSSRENDIVIDFFGGGGSTLIACERLNRTCYMMELSPEWCNVIIDRWEKETGKKAELLM